MKATLQRGIKHTLFLLSLIASLSFSCARLSAQTAKTYVHIVQEKETVYSISRRYKVSEEDIYRLNPGSEYGIRIGEHLQIPLPQKADSEKGQKPSSTTAGTQANEHVVQSGDTLYAIARRYGTTVPALLKLNPGLEADQIAVGRVIKIAPSTSENKTSQKQTAPTQARQQTQANKAHIALLLPIGKNGPARYVHFYEGFLMGMLKLKERGISARIDTYHAENEQAIQQLIDEGKLDPCNIIIGGHTDGTTRLLGRYVGGKNAIYVSPFIAQSHSNQYPNTVYQLNPDQKDLYPYLSLAFADKAHGRRIVFVEHPSGNHIPVINALKKRLDKENVPYKVCSFYDAKAGNWGFEKDSKETIIMLNDGRQEPTQMVIKSIEKSFGNSSNIHLFGYPEWQSYGHDFCKKIGALGSTIYSSFYFDETKTESLQFAKEYNKWFNGSRLDGYPKYAVLGYDVASYFVQAWTGYAMQIPQAFGEIPHDGLQSDFVFRKADGENHFTSVGLFFINYSANGVGTRHKVIF